MSRAMNRMNMRAGLQRALTLALAGLVLAACDGDGGGGSAAGGSGSGGGAAPGASLRGSLHGGQSPVTGSTITFYAAGISPSGSTALASTTTDARGNFEFGTITCPSASTPTYVVASGGNPGLTAGTNNSALQLMAALGPCGNIAASVNIDEVTTVAAAYALNGFIGPGGCVDCSVGVPADVSNVHGRALGLANAMGNAARLADVATGGASPPLPSASACAASTAPVNCGAEERLNSLANSLAACVNSSGPTSAQCVELFDCATPGATFSAGACTVPTGSSLAADTLTAALEIARNPGQVPVAGVYYVATRNAVFSPALSAAPTDWTLALNFGGGGLYNPDGIAIDASGNAWVANNDNSLSEFSPAGTPLSGGGGYTGGGLSQPHFLAIDLSGNVWAANFGASSLSEFSAGGVPLSQTTSGAGGLDTPQGIAIDAGGNVWLANFDNSLSEFNSAATALSGSSGYSGGGLNVPRAIAIDANGNVWVPNSGNTSLSEFNSAGTPVSGSNGYTGGGLHSPAGIAIDPTGDVWVANQGNSNLSEFNSTGTPLSGSSGYTGGGLGTVVQLAIDASGNVWVTNQGGSVSELNSSGAPLSPTSGYTGGGLADPEGIGIDPSGDVWIANSVGNNTLTELIGAAAPTRAPLVSAISGGFAP